MKLNGRQVAILVLLVLFGALAVAPVLVLGNRTAGASDDPAYQALKIYSRSQLGDRSADAAAIEIFPTLIRRNDNGVETFSRLGTNDTCWELDLSKSSEPYTVDRSRCDKE